MSIKEGTNRKVSFDTRDKLGDKIDKVNSYVRQISCKGQP